MPDYIAGGGIKNTEEEIRDATVWLRKKTIAELASEYNEATTSVGPANELNNFLTAEFCALIFDNSNLTAAKAASIMDNSNLTAAKAASIMDNSNLTAAKAASIMDNSNLTAAKAASIMDNSNLTAAKAASIMDNSNLTAAKAASICDSANITSAKIKAILDTGSLTVADKIAALLDGDSLTAADAATHVNSGTYTDDLMASAFDSSYLAAAKAASIFNDTNLTLAKAASIFEDENLSLSKIGEIIIHDNISDSRVQEILNETDYETRALTGVSAVINVLSDDWADNKLASRDNRATTPSSIHEENEFSQKFRPEWSSSGDATAANNRLELGPADGEVHITPYINLPKKWEHRWYASSSSNIYYQLFYEDDNNFWASKRRGSSVGSPPTIYCELYKMSGGTSSTPISDVTGTWGEYAKITRDENGNWEVFHTGGSVGTTIDTWLPTNNYFRIWHDGSEHNALVTSSWFKIYDSI